MSHVVVVVLGDVGRSPRMQYHAKSLASLRDTRKVTLIGYSGEKCMDEVEHNPKISLRRFSISGIKFLDNFSICRVIFRGISMMLLLFTMFLITGRFDVVIIQNPPCLPAIIISSIFSSLHGGKLILDWHNLGFKMFEEKHGPAHVLVRVSRWLEYNITKLAHSHICVSKAMQEWLLKNFLVSAHVVYDKPASVFRRSRPAKQLLHDLFLRLQLTDKVLFPVLAHELLCPVESISTIQTYESRDGGAADAVAWRQADFCPLIVSSTSWTPDEDFNLFLEALLLVESALRQLAGSRRLVVAVTGKGPTQAQFVQRVAGLEQTGRLQRVKIRTIWLEAEDYPTFMGCANLGVCLHTSTSGIDLPMKVLDMFGAGVAVCAAHFPAIDELVRSGDNGLIFHNAQELAEQITRLLFPVHGINPLIDSLSKFQPAFLGESAELQRLRNSAAQIESWDDNWAISMQPVVLDCLSAPKQYHGLSLVSAIVVFIGIFTYMYQ